MYYLQYLSCIIYNIYRASTSSASGSDSGVSTGSPRQSITDQMEFINIK